MRVLITGSGQDSSLLTFLFKVKQLDVTVYTRRRSDEIPDQMKLVLSKLDKLNLADVNFVYGDITDYQNLFNTIATGRYDVIFHMAAQSFVPPSYESPISTHMVNELSAYAILEAVRKHSPQTKVFLAASSEVFGLPRQIPQTLDTPFDPVSPYAISKTALLYIAEYYRRVWKLKVYDFITFNHESELRGPEFVTMKIVKNLVEKKHVVLGNVNATKDWGYAPEYMKIISKTVIEGEPGRYILCTGELASVKDFAEYVISKVGGFYTVDRSLFRPIDANRMTCNKYQAPEIPKFTWRDVADIMIKFVKDGQTTFDDYLIKASKELQV